jgi:hypothetical protein
MSKINLDKLRKISKKCSDNKRVQEYVRDVCLKIRELLINYAIDTKQDEDKILEKYLGYETVPKSFSLGQIPTKYINYAIEYGNIREQTTMIMNFCNSNCLVILWAVEKKKYLSQEGIDILQKKIYNLTGISSIQKFNKYIRDCEINGCINITPRKFLSYVSDGAVTASRLIDKLREERVKKINKYHMNIKNVYPKLSPRELEYINSNNKISNNILPWISGLQYWKVNDKHFYIKLMKRNKQMIVCGPSSNSDLIISILRLFDNFDINLAIFACISHLCNAPHHSPCEVLLAGIPYGLNDWTIDEDSFKYVNKKLKEYM